MENAESAESESRSGLERAHAGGPAHNLLGWLRDQPGIVVTAATGLAVLTGSLAARRYYTEFHVSPREVGYTTADFVMVSALLVLYAAVASLLGLMFGVAFGDFANSLRRKGPKGWRRALAEVVGITLVVLYLGDNARVDGLLATGLFIAFMGITLMSVQLRMEPEPQRLHATPRTVVGIVSAGVIVTSLSLLFTSGATAAADRTKETGGAQPATLTLGAPVIANVVSGLDDPALNGRCVLYLGSADGHAVLWAPDLRTADKHDGQTHVVPADTLQRRAECVLQPPGGSATRVKP